MRVLGSRIASAAVAAALIFNSTAGIAASAPPATPPQASQASWLTLSMLSPSGAIGLAGAAAQPAADVRRHRRVPRLRQRTTPTAECRCR